MKAARIVAPGRMVLEDVPVPEFGPHDVRVRIEGCGVCASNLGPWKGLPWTTYPLPPGEGGHEAWGVVDAIGSAVAGVREGDQVAALTFRSYSEYDVAQEDCVVPLPPGVAGTAFPGEAFGCAMNIFRRSEIGDRHVVAVVGVGFLGAVLTRLAHLAGARIIAISRRPFALDLARAVGADEILALRDGEDVVDQVRELTRGDMCDRVIEAAGAQHALDLAGQLAGERARLVIAGYHQDGPRQVNMQMWNWKGLDVINAHERDPAAYVQGIRAAVEAIERGDLDPDVFVTHELPLTRLDEALQATQYRPHGFLKAVVRP